jgi:galactose mutarotase-like enzyme
MITITSNDCEANIHPLGAELQSLRNLNTGLEFMWQADSRFWGKHSPVLFPIVGTLKENSYVYEGKSYSLPRHGFAREKLFTSEKLNDSKAVFTLEADAATKEVYPFDFRFQLIYELKGTVLSCTYAVSNPGNKDLWFSVGAHPAFKVPLVEGATYESHYLQFDKDEPLLRWHLDSGLIGTQSSLVETHEGRISLSPSLFYDDAIVLMHLQSQKVTLGSTAHAHGLHFHFKGFPFLGIWAAKDAPFVCIEPWCGHADTVGHNQQLTAKPGIEMLEPGKDWLRTWKVDLF